MTTNDKYRTEGNSLYEFDEISNAYIHVYKNSRLTGKKLIEEYEKEKDEFCNSRYEDGTDI